MTSTVALEEVFAALADARRRTIVEILGREGERTVTQLVDALDLPQPAVSKHLATLREAGIVDVQPRGRLRVYRLNARGLRVAHEWTGLFENHWKRHLGRVKQRAERLARAPQSHRTHNDKDTP
jgi:DNA-binding transcriptional ArsR family regulator